MNDKVKYKLIRNLHYSLFKDYSKTILVDKDKMISNHFDDIDLESIHHILEKIETNTPLDILISYACINICPSLTLSRNFSKTIIQQLNEEVNEMKIFMDVLHHEYFGELSFVIGVIIINHFYFKKNDTFLVVYDSIKNRLIESSSNIEEFKNIFEEIILSNRAYHTLSLFKSLDEIKDVIKTIHIDNFVHLKVHKIYVHGSFARGNNNKYSDVDLIVETSIPLQKDYLDVHLFFRMLFEKHLGDKVDITLTDGNKKESQSGFLNNAYSSAVLIREINQKTFLRQRTKTKRFPK